MFAGTGLDPGERFGDNWGIEIDHTDESSPSQVQVLAEIPDLYGPGFTAQMTYYETESGARVFSAGAFSIAGQIGDPHVSRVVANLWRRLAAEADAALRGVAACRPGGDAVAGLKRT